MSAVGGSGGGSASKFASSTASGSLSGRTSLEVAMDLRVGKCARDKGYITEDDLAECTGLQALSLRHFGHPIPLVEVLFLRGLVDVEQVHTLLDAAGKRPQAPTQMGSRALFGKIAVEKGFITPEQVLRCLDVQRGEVKAGKPPRPLGSILVSEGFLTEAQTEEILLLQRAAQK